MANTRTGSYQRQVTVDSEDVGIENSVQPASEAVSAKGVEIDTDAVIRTDELDFEQFMRDELDVFINEAQNENDPNIVEVNVNGDYRMAIRGETVKLRRYHVAALARAKQSRVRQRKVVNADGSMGFVEEQVLSLTYPFSIVSDPRPQKGAPWLKQLLSNPA
jgi:hypothetical protein